MTEEEIACWWWYEGENAYEWKMPLKRPMKSGYVETTV
jgi:hypothetical protein